ncbi:glycosyltransferase [Bordetella ansorpii]|uniref:Glycosyltransferase n=1 Tax=Bordetella ansorpii TaxID=288768 RepID=A0A157RH00_9BORD|nr:glycosyltransferase [Bordetella ansorpii]SAI57184.1 glycosyltransferase [Bordetella ansorpii]
MDYWLLAEGNHRLPHTPGASLWVFAERLDPDVPEYGLVHPVKLGYGWLPRKLRGAMHTPVLKRMRREMRLDLTISMKATVAADLAVCGFTLQGETRARGLRRGWLTRRRMDMERQAYAASGHIVAHSRAIADELIGLYGIPASKITVAYPPVDEQVFQPIPTSARTRLRAALGMPPDKVVFLFPSTGHHRKGLAALIRFFGQTDLPVLLLIAGNAPSAALPPNVRYLGYQRDMAPLYQASDFTIMNSAYEPFGLVGVESVLCGTPTLQTLVTGCVETLSQEACTTFQHDDAAQIHSAIRCATLRAQSGSARLESPRACLSYAPSLDEHARILLDLGRKVLS